MSKQAPVIAAALKAAATASNLFIYIRLLIDQINILDYIQYPLDY